MRHAFVCSSAVGLVLFSTIVLGWSQESMVEASPPNAAAVEEVGSRLQLFLDDDLIEEMKGVELKLHEPSWAEIAMRRDRPWEDSTLYDPVVIKDGERYRMWYRANFNSPPFYTAYAESTDGINWTKPNLGLVEFQGSTENNIVWAGDHSKPGGMPDVLCVFRDDNPNTPNDERYKATGLAYDRGLQGLASPDGLRWRLIQQERVVPNVGEFDTHSVTFWDATRQEYVCYTRGFKDPAGNEVLRVPPGATIAQIPLRSIRRTASSDFKNFPTPEMVTIENPAGTGDEHLYKNAATPYFRRPDVHLMFPKRFREDRKPDPSWPVSGVSDIVFMFSKDGVHWNRRHRQAFMRPGIDPLNWHDRAIEVGPGLVPTGPNEMSLYFIEHYRSPEVQVRRGVLRTDGLISINAGFLPGEFRTRPLVFSGNSLQANISTSAVGRMTVEILDDASKPIPGFTAADCDEVYGDEIGRTITWRGSSDVSSLAGKAIRLRFSLEEADLYSFQFVDDRPN